MKFYSEDVLKTCMRANLNDAEYEKFTDILRNTPVSESVPVSYMQAYAEHHDPVCEINIKTMINRYRNGDKYD